jgi:uncharacterized membrane protein
MTRTAFSIRHPAVALLALILSLFAGQRGSADEPRANRIGQRPAIAAPLTPAAQLIASAARKPWETRGHPSKAGKRQAAAPRRKPWQTRGHPRKAAPTPRLGSAHGPRAP